MKTETSAVRPPLISLFNADVSFQKTQILHNICWHLRASEHWAILGAGGSGKSTLLRLIRGEIHPDQPDEGKRVYALRGEAQESPIGIKQKIAMISAESQAAYVIKGWDMRGEDVIATGLFDSIWLYEKPTKSQRKMVEKVIHLLRLGNLREKSILSMSQGEARKILIGRALVSRPAVLILDEFLNGLDIPSRRELWHLVGKIADNGTQILMAAHRSEELSKSITHVMLLKEGRVIAQGLKDAVLKAENIRRTFQRKTSQKQPGIGLILPGAVPKADDFLISVKNANVYLDNKRILRSISWRMNKGEHWAILGRNGSGKSTLLKLIMGEAHPAIKGEIHRFGYNRREGLSEIRRKIGFISPGLQAAYKYPVTGEEAVQSGFFSSIGLYDEVAQKQKRLARKWIKFLHLEHLAEKNMDEMSYGEQRLILVARSMVGNPAMLALDEPCSGLDNNTKADLLDLLGRLSNAGVNLIFVTHHLDEIIPAITHVMVMSKGCIAAQGEKDEILREEKLSEFFGNE